MGCVQRTRLRVTRWHLTAKLYLNDLAADCQDTTDRLDRSRVPLYAGLDSGMGLEEPWKNTGFTREKSRFEDRELESAKTADFALVLRVWRLECGC